MSYCFVANFIRFQAVQKFWKSVKIWQIYREFKSGNFFETQCCYACCFGSWRIKRAGSVIDWLGEYEIFSMGYLRNGGRKRNEIWHKGSLGDEDDARTPNTHVVQRKHAMPDSTMKNTDRNIIQCTTHQGAPHTGKQQNLKNVLLMRHQPEAFTSYLGDDQACYLYS